MTTMFYAKKTRTVDAAIDMPDGRTMFVLSVPGEGVAYPTLAVTGTRFEDSGLFTGLTAHHRVSDLAAFTAKLPTLIEAGVYD